MADDPIITPSQFLALEGVEPTDNDCEVAVVGFCPFHELKKKVDARPLTKSLFVHVDPAHQFQAHVGTCDVLMVDCIYGGPVCATVIEEMAYLGVRYVLGYGYSGSLRKEIEPGKIVLASSGFISDGTSREYCNGSQVDASPELLAVYEEVKGSFLSAVVAGKAWTTDAIYRECPSKIASWFRAGADFVNMDTSSFYAAARTVGVEALYFSLVSDYVGEEEWDQQFPNIGESRAQLHDLILELIPKIGGEQGREKN